MWKRKSTFLKLFDKLKMCLNHKCVNNTENLILCQNISCIDGYVNFIVKLISFLQVCIRGFCEKEFSTQSNCDNVKCNENQVFWDFILFYFIDLFN